MCSGKSKVSIEEKLCQKNNMRKQGEFCAFFIAVGDVWWKCSYVFSRRDRIMFPWACPKLHATTLIEQTEDLQNAGKTVTMLSVDNRIHRVRVQLTRSDA